MFKELVKVENILGNKLEVRFTRSKMCSCCKIEYLCSKEANTLIIDNIGLDLRKGDQIEVGIESKKAFFATSLTFLIPMLIFIIILLVSFRKNELLSFSLALAGIFIYYGIMKVFLKKWDSNFQLKVLGKI